MEEYITKKEADIYNKIRKLENCITTNRIFSLFQATMLGIGGTLAPFSFADAKYVWGTLFSGLAVWNGINIYKNIRNEIKYRNQISGLEKELENKSEGQNIQ